MTYRSRCEGRARRAQSIVRPSAGLFVLAGRTAKRAKDLLAWARAFERGKHLRVARTRVGKVLVSTIFLGIDHGFGGPPRLFESALVPDHGKIDVQDRCATWKQAMRQHHRLVDQLRHATRSS